MLFRSEENQAGGYVYLMGASDSLEKELVDAALFAFTSDWEGLPNALMEAMALGLPIVATLEGSSNIIQYTQKL